MHGLRVEASTVKRPIPTVVAIVEATVIVVVVVYVHIKLTAVVVVHEHLLVLILIEGRIHELFAVVVDWRRVDIVFVETTCRIVVVEWHLSIHTVVHDHVVGRQRWRVVERRNERVGRRCTQ